ncbi:hypothetical protein D3C71_1740780 [compost metagenome]
MTLSASGANGNAEATPFSKWLPNCRDARMPSMRAWVSGGATANSQSGRVDENATPWGDSSTVVRPERLSNPSKDSTPTRNITTPMMALDGVSLS